MLDDMKNGYQPEPEYILAYEKYIDKTYDDPNLNGISGTNEYISDGESKSVPKKSSISKSIDNT